MYYRFWYRPLSKLLHKFNLHHTRSNPFLANISQLSDEYYFVPTQCDWCGIRGQIMTSHEEFKKLLQKAGPKRK